MIVALIDNGSVMAAAHCQLREVAAALSARTGVPVEAVSWKHSHRVPAAALDGKPAATLTRWIEAHLAQGEREFLFVPYFISPQGAIGSALRTELEQIRSEHDDFTFAFCAGLAERGALAPIVADRVRETLRARELRTPAVIVVDHGGPSAESAHLRDSIATAARQLLDSAIGPLTAASMEGDDYPHNQPLFADVLTRTGFDRGAVVIAPLFLAPGRHAGESGDLARIARTAEARAGATNPKLRCHFTPLVGNHPRAIAALAESLNAALERRTTLHFA